MEEIGSLTISDAITQGRNSSSCCHLIDIRTVLDLMSIPRERESWQTNYFLIGSQSFSSFDVFFMRGVPFLNSSLRDVHIYL